MPKAHALQQHAPLDGAALLAWYDRHARVLPWRTGPADRARGVRPDPYRVWLSEIMLQQTTVAAVGKYYARFLSLWPTVADLAAAPLEAILVEWAGLGYYARARNLHACAQAVVERFGGAFPGTSAELLALPGIGPYTAAAIAAIACDEPVAVVDGNVDRVLARYLALPVPVRDAKDVIRAAVQAAVPPRAGDFAQALMDLGATICAPRIANCLICPLAEGCTGR
ncbi:MAG TPA: A/G-specific adenine glycosylase, partial [Devosia sp.]|nr:A/G-specific adenine glycosylase [Devosia sp.]